MLILGDLCNYCVYETHFSFYFSLLSLVTNEVQWNRTSSTFGLLSFYLFFLFNLRDILIY